MSLPKPPDPAQVLEKLKEAIESDKPPRLLLFEMLTQPGVVSNLLAEMIIRYRESWILLCSPQGDTYIKKHLDEILSYWETLARDMK